MSLLRCPSCNAKLPPSALDQCPRCGFALQLVSEEFHRLTQAPTGAVIFPFLTLKKLSKAGRQAVCQAIDKARRG